MKHLTSIIVPFYNEEKLLEQSVLDLLREDFHKEIILVNDGSVDNSKIIALNLEESYENITLLDSKEKEKLFEELNKLDFNSKFLKVA